MKIDAVDFLRRQFADCEKQNERKYNFIHRVIKSQIHARKLHFPSLEIRLPVLSGIFNGLYSGEAVDGDQDQAHNR